MEQRGREVMPAVITVCANCGAVNFHALAVLGLTPEELKEGKELYNG